MLFLLEYFSFFRTKQGKRIWSSPERRLHKYIAVIYFTYMKCMLVLTSNIDIKRMVRGISNSIVSCTAVCSSSSSADVYNNPRVPKEHYITIGAILQYSGPSNVWSWFTSCVTKQSQTCTFIYSLVTTGTAGTAGKSGFN